MLFDFWKYRNLPIPAPLETDVHSHLIPGIDDGSKDIEESLTLLRALENIGYKKVITTPHIMADTYRNTPEGIYKGLDILLQAAKEDGLHIAIEAAAEYYLDNDFLSHLKSGKILSISDKYILCETSYILKPLQFDEMINGIIEAGYIPLLAHPERYRYMQNYAYEYRMLKEMGVYFQVNINSFGGHYGKEAKRKATFLSEHGMIDFLGSDIHHLRQVEMLSQVQKQVVYKKIYKHNTILNHTL